MMPQVSGAHAPGTAGVTASRLGQFLRLRFLGLTPQAMNVSPLRGSDVCFDVSVGGADA